MENSIERLTSLGSDGRQSPRSYVIRAGHMTDNQKDALRRLYPHYGLRWEPDKQVDAHSLLGYSSDIPCIVEIGFGMGEIGRASYRERV